MCRLIPSPRKVHVVNRIKCNIHAVHIMRELGGKTVRGLEYTEIGWNTKRVKMCRCNRRQLETFKGLHA